MSGGRHTHLPRRGGSVRPMSLSLGSLVGAGQVRAQNKINSSTSLLILCKDANILELFLQVYRGDYYLLESTGFFL